MSRRQSNPGASRRTFLRRAALATGSAALGFPAVVKAQGPIALRWQSSWHPKDIFHQFALDFVKKLDDMTGGDLKITVLPLDSVVPAHGLLDAVAKGKLDGCHGVLNNHYGRHQALGLWGNGPAFGMDANMVLAWHRHGGGRELLKRIYAAIKADVTSFLYGPMPTQPLGWFKKPISRPDDFKGLKFRAPGMASDIYAELGAKVDALPRDEIASAMESGRLDAAELNNATSDRNAGLPEVAQVYMLQSYHQGAEQLEILFNREKFDALPPKIKAVIENAVEAASADMSWKAIDRYSRDYGSLREQGKVRMLKTPDAVLQRQLAAYDTLAKKRQGDALFREVEQSQRQFAERAVRWLLDTQVSPRLAYRHYFGPKPAPRPPRRRRK